MAYLTKILDSFYKEESLSNIISGTTDFILPKGVECPILIEAVNIEGHDFVLSYHGTPLHVRCDEEPGFKLPSRGHFDKLIWIQSINQETKQIKLMYLKCGNGVELDMEDGNGLEIGYGNDVILKEQNNIQNIPSKLLNRFSFEYDGSFYIFIETYPNSDDMFQIQGLTNRASIKKENGVWKLDNYNKKSFPKKYSSFQELEVRKLSNFKFVEESESKEALAIISEREKSNATILKLWAIYSTKEKERAEEYQTKVGKVKYNVIKYPQPHVCRIRITVSEQQKDAIFYNRAQFLKSSFQCGDIDEHNRYDVKSINPDGSIDIVDEYENLPRYGELTISTIGNVFIDKRRMNALKKLRQYPNLVQRNLLFAIEDQMSAAIVNKLPHHYKPITVRTQKFLKEKFCIEDPTQDQKDAIEIALNTPDLAVIQGPPGTGKSTVIAAICDRLLEIAEKEEENQNNKKLILVSAFQNDTVEHIASKIYTLGLPTVKVGRESQTIHAEDQVIEHLKKSIDSALDYYSEKAQPRFSVKLARLKELFIKEHSITEIKDEVDSILAESDMDEEIVDDWNLFKEYSHDDERRFNKELSILEALKTGASEYDASVYRNIRKLLRSSIKLDDEDRKFLEETIDPIEPTTEQLSILQGIKNKYLNDYKTNDESLGYSSLPNWFDRAIAYASKQEALNIQDKDTFMCSALESIRDNLKGNDSYIRSSIQNYGETLAATNQTAGSKEVRQLKFEDVILEEAARSNPLDLLIPMMVAQKRIIMVGDQKQLPQILERDVENEALSTFDDQEVIAKNRNIYQESLFDIIFKNLEKGANPIRYKTLTTQFRMHPVIARFINDIYYPNIKLQSGIRNMEAKKQHHMNLPWVKDKVAVFCNVPAECGGEKGRSKIRPVEAERVVKILCELEKDPAFKNLTVGIITFYAKQVDEIFHAASKFGFSEYETDGSYSISEKYKMTADGREKLRIGSVDSFQGKEFDIVILSTVRSNDFERSDDNVNKVFGFLTLSNRLNVAFSRAEKLIITVGDAKMFSDEYAKTYVRGLYEFYTNLSVGKYGNRI